MAKLRLSFVKLWNGIINFIGLSVSAVAIAVNEVINIVAKGLMLIFAVIYKLIASITGGLKYFVSSLAGRDSVTTTVLLFPINLIETIAIMPYKVSEAIYKATYDTSNVAILANTFIEMISGNLIRGPFDGSGRTSPALEVFFMLIGLPINLLTIN